MTAQPRMLAPTQIEAHVTRLTAVREGLRKFEVDDGRASECGRILEVAINTLNSEPFKTPKGEAETETVLSSDTGGDEVESPDPTEVPPPNEAPEESRQPSTGYGSTRGIV